VCWAQLPHALFQLYSSAFARHDSKRKPNVEHGNPRIIWASSISVVSSGSCRLSQNLHNQAGSVPDCRGRYSDQGVTFQRGKATEQQKCVVQGC